MSHRFESQPEVHRDAMSDAEVREVLARLAQEKISPQVKDVADIAGASEADVRRVLEQLRAEQATAAEPVKVVQEPQAHLGVFPMARSRRGLRLAIASALVFLMLGLLMMLSSVRTVEIQPATEAAPQGTPAIDQATAPAPIQGGN